MLSLCFFRATQIKASPFIIGVILNGMAQGVTASQEHIDAIKDFTEYLTDEITKRAYTIPTAATMQGILHARLTEIKNFLDNEKEKFLDEYDEMIKTALFEGQTDKYGSIVYDYNEVYRNRQASDDLDTENIKNYLGTGATFDQFFYTKWHRFNFLSEDIQKAQSLAQHYYKEAELITYRIMHYATFGGDLATHLVDNSLELADKGIQYLSQLENEISHANVGYFCIKGYMDSFYGNMDLYLNF